AAFFVRFMPRVSPPVSGLLQPILSEAHCFGCGGLQAALQAAPSLAWSCPRYAISDGGFAASLPDFLFVPYHPEAYHPAPYRHINRLLSKEPRKKNATLQKSEVRYFSA
ncbi:MAG: hypothetical protein ACI307_05565, partial [Sodaliphilus sp.]